MIRPARLVVLAGLVTAAAAAVVACAPADEAQRSAGEEEEAVEAEREADDEAREDHETTTVLAHVQVRPGGPTELVEMEVHPVPVDPPTVAADEADLDDDELVLGVVVDGQPMAFPIRYLALTEVANTRVADTPLTPTW